MRLILARMVWAFDLRVADTEDRVIKWEEQDVFGIVIKRRLDVVFVERNA